MDSNNENSEETDGFDIQAGLSWIYPTNYPLRDYQFNIIQEALYKNTLVSLPTGLGKTFIAAVVMYNFYRWYPTGKIVFMAPTKPLVKQQVDACYDIMAIPKDVTVELTGTKQNSTRKDIWTDKRVFFVTPQVLQNDLDSFPDLGVSIKCIVFDEAHKARGNYAYCEVIRKLKYQAKYFRVLALSATPGNSIDDVKEVINNLMISHLEFRTEESVDVKPYVFQRKLEVVVVPLGGKLEQVKADYSEILEKYVRTLIKYKIIQGNCSTITKGRIFMIKKEFQERNVRDPHYNEVMKTLNICMTLYHAYELLIRHGLRGFLSFFEEHIDKPLLRGNTALMRIVDDVRDYMGPIPNVDPLPDGCYPEVPLSTKFGHPKFYKLRDILLSHFTSSEDNSRVIVFFEYRDSVMEAFIVLLQARPMIRAKIFLGQKSGITQRVQLNVIKSFRQGDCNTLLSTCIGEEGLDVGEVDLIVCFDISNKSPIRMVQRMGRTGRKREGQVVVLVTEGKEQQTLNECLIHKNNIKNWAGSSKVLDSFYVESPRMVPVNISPQCLKMQITVKKPVITKSSTLKDMFKTITSGSSPSLILSDDVEIIEIQERIPEPLFLFNKSLAQIVNCDWKPTYNKYIENQRSIQSGVKIKSSDASSLFVSLMKFADSKRFNIPLTQDVGRETGNKNLKQGDIRSMFVMASGKNSQPSQDEFITQKTQTTYSSTTTQSSNTESKSDDLYKELHTEISNYLSIELTLDRQCDVCSQLFQCNINEIVKENTFFEDLCHWIPPDLSIVEKITIEDLEFYEKSYIDCENKENCMENSILQLMDGNDLSAIFSDSNIEEKSMKERLVNFNVPKSFSNLLDTFNISSTYPDKDKSNINEIVSENNKLNDLLSFFKLEKIEDIFGSSDHILNDTFNSDVTIICSNGDADFQNYQMSPILGTQMSPIKQPIENNEPSSPVLGPCKKFKSLKERSFARKSLDIIDTSIEENTSNSKNKFTVSQRITKISTRTLPATQKDDDECKDSEEEFEDENLLGLFGTRKRLKTSKESLDLGDLCDLSVFGLTSAENSTKNVMEKSKNVRNLDEENSSNAIQNSKINLCDASRFFNKSTRKEENDKKSESNGVEPTSRQEKAQSEDDSSLNKKHYSQHNTSSLEIDDLCDLSVFGLKENNGHDESNNFDITSTASQDLDATRIEFNDFFRNLSGKHVSTQRQVNAQNSDIEKLQGMKPMNTKGNSSDKNDVIIGVEERPTLIDLTLSPNVNEKSFKRKISSQMLSTQVKRLPSKTTQPKLSTLWSKPTEKSDKTNLDHTHLDDLDDFRDKFNRTQPKQSGSSSHKKEVALQASNSSSGELNKSFNAKKPSPVFKKPDIRKFASKRTQNEPEKLSLKTKSIPSSSNSNSVKFGTESDDEFESFPDTSRIVPRLNRTFLENNSDDEFETTICTSQSLRKDATPKCPQIGKLQASKKRNVARKKRCDFIEEEAEVSDDTVSISDDENENAEDDKFEESFVDDQTNNLVNDTQMHAKYLQSLRSPHIGPKFKIPSIQKPITSDIFSQPVDPEEFNSYVNDSFCVNTQNVDSGAHELSELEILEKKLKEKRKNKRKASSYDDKKSKRKRIMFIDSDSE